MVNLQIFFNIRVANTEIKTSLEKTASKTQQMRKIFEGKKQGDQVLLIHEKNRAQKSRASVPLSELKKVHYDNFCVIGIKFFN